MTPASIGPYRILEPIGRGGMGVVYRAEHSSTREVVALKTVHVPRESQLAGIRGEVHVLRGLTHPGVVRILDEGLHEGTPWYAMELLEGRTLHDYIDRLWGRGLDMPTMSASGGPASEDELGQSLSSLSRPERKERLPAAGGKLPEVLSLFRSLCWALSYIHGQGLVHRDLKPSNVFIRPDGSPVLVDFGLVSRFRGAVGRETLEVGGQVTGTAWYMAPEQAVAQFVDARSDLYALGVLLYETVTGQPPFLGPTVAAVVAQHLSEEPVPPSHLVEALPAVLEELILRLLAKQRRDRFGFADDVADLLLQAGAEEALPPAATEPAAYLYRPELQGRARVLRDLGREVSLARDGAGRILLLGGESGVGKTSVAAALARMATLDGFRVLTGECVPQGPPLHPFRPFLQAVADRCLGKEGSAERLLGPQARVLARYEPALAALPLLASQPDLPELPAEASRERLFGQLTTALTGFAAESPLLLVLDDLQWADEVTFAFLKSLSPALLAGRKLLLLGTHRVEEARPELAELAGRAGVVSFSLGRLDEGTVGAMVGDMLALREPHEPFVRFLSRQSEGNPFFIAEYLRSAVSLRLLFRRHGTWRIAGEGEPSEKAYEALGLPRSLRELVGRRLEGLSESAQRAASLACVLGREVDDRYLVVATPALALSDLGLLEAVQELLGRQVLEREESGRLRFVHDKLREVAYSRLDPDSRRQLHGEAARAIETGSAPSDLALHHAELANHWELAGVDGKALEYCEKAGEGAIRGAAFREGADFLTRALALDERLGRSSGVLRRARWERQLAGAYFGLGDLGRCAEHANAAMGLVDRPMPATKGGLARALLSNVLEQVVHRNLPRGLFLAREGRWEALVEASHAAQRLSERHYFAADALAMVTASLRSVNLAERTRLFPQVARTYALLGLVAGTSGAGGLARTYFREARRVAESSNDEPGLTYALYAEASFTLGIGDFPTTKRLALEALAVGERVGDVQELEVVRTILTHVEHYTGELRQAERSFLAIRDSARRRESLQHDLWGTYGSARSLIPLGRLDEAIERLVAAQEMLVRVPDHGSAVIVHGLLARTRWLRGEPVPAKAAADEALKLLAQSMASVFETYRGYAHAAEVYFELAASATVAEERATARAVARRALKDLGAFAFRFPLARPARHLVEGRALELEGRARKARRAFEVARDTARRLTMPYEEALAHAALARLSPVGSPERAEGAAYARNLFSKMGCTRDLADLDAMLKE